MCPYYAYNIASSGLVLAFILYLNTVVVLCTLSCYKSVNIPPKGRLLVYRHQTLFKPSHHSHFSLIATSCNWAINNRSCDTQTHTHITPHISHICISLSLSLPPSLTHSVVLNLDKAISSASHFISFSTAPSFKILVVLAVVL